MKYPSNKKLRAIARSLMERVSSGHCCNFEIHNDKIIAGIHDRLMDRAENFSPDAEECLKEIAMALHLAIRSHVLPSVSNRADYLIHAIAYGESDWIKPLKRRMEYLR